MSSPGSFPAPAALARTPPRLAWLDGWRVVAATLVFLTHYKPVSGRFHALADEGHIGVALFFVISGAVLGLQMPDAGCRMREGVGGDGRSAWWRLFYLKRFSKIYLLHTLLYLACLPFLADTGWTIPANLTLAKGLFESQVFTGLPQSWSLTAELMLYGALPFLGGGRADARCRMPDAGKSERRKAGGGGVWLWICLAAGVLACAVWPFGAVYTAAGRAFAFALGLALARRWQRQSSRLLSEPAFVSATPWLRWLLAGAALAVLMLALGDLAPPAPVANVLMALGHLPTPDFHAASPEAGTFAALLANVVGVPLAFVFLIELTRPISPLQHPASNIHYRASSDNQQPTTDNSSPASRLPSPVSLLGRASYAFYLIHIGPVGRVVYLVAGHNTALTYVLLWMAALAVHLAVEYPILRIIAQKGRKI